MSSVSTLRWGGGRQITLVPFVRKGCDGSCLINTCVMKYCIALYASGIGPVGDQTRRGISTTATRWLPSCAVNSSVDSSCSRITPLYSVHSSKDSITSRSAHSAVVCPRRAARGVRGHGVTGRGVTKATLRSKNSIR